MLVCSVFVKLIVMFIDIKEEEIASIAVAANDDDDNSKKV